MSNPYEGLHEAQLAINMVPLLDERIKALEDRVKALEDHNKAESKAYDDIHNLMEAHNKKMHELFGVHGKRTE